MRPTVKSEGEQNKIRYTARRNYPNLSASDLLKETV